MNNGIPLITSKNLNNGDLDFSTAKFISEQDSIAINNRSRVDDGDILFAMIGSIGNPVLVKKEREFSIKNVALFKNVNQIMNMQYVYFYLEFEQDTMKRISSGGVQSFVSLSCLRNYLIPLPPLSEQQRIVNRIFELKPMLYDLIHDETKLEILQKSFPKKMKDSILQYAIQGKLTEQLESDGNARDLVEDIQKEKERLIKEGKIKKEKPLPAITEDEIPFDIPENWCWVRLGNVLQVNPRNHLEDDMEVSFVPMTLISEGYINRFESENRIWKSIKSGFTHFAENDVVLAKITPCFQNLKSAVMSNLVNGFGAGTTELHVLRRYNNQTDCEYLLYFLKNPLFIKDGLATMKGTAGQQRVSTDFIKECLFPLPPLTEQHRIVEKLDQLLPLCDALE